MKKEKIKIILKYTPDNEAIAFFPELPANYGNILCYQHIGQHGESSLSYARDCKACQGYETDINALLTELKNIYSDYDLVLRKRIHHNDLTNKEWNWRIENGKVESVN